MFAACRMLAVHAATAQTQAGDALTNHAAKVGALSAQLRWRDEAGMKQYDAVKDDVNRRILSELDGFISDNFQATSATADQVVAGLDGLLGRSDGDVTHNVAFSANLPSGRFLIIGIELRRGGEAINEDAFSFRAYAESGNKFVLVSKADDLGNSAGVDLRAKVASRTASRW